MSRFFKWKKKNLLCFLQIYGRTGGQNGNAQTIYNGFFDAFKIIHACNDIQITGNYAKLLKEDVHFLFGAGSFLTYNDRIFDKVLKGNRFILKFQIMTVDRGCYYKFILAERKKYTAFIAGILSDQRQVHSAVKDAVDGLCTVWLD